MPFLSHCLITASYPIFGLSVEEAVQLARAVVQSGPLGRGRETLLKWLLEAANGMRQAPTTRAKAVKALSGVIHADPRIATLSEVQTGISRALKVRLLSAHSYHAQALTIPHQMGW